MSQWLYQVIAALGHYVISQVRGIGKLALFSWQVFLRLGAGFSRFGLVVQQIHFIGNYSLVIISVSGLFVGFVLGLQARGDDGDLKEGSKIEQTQSALVLENLISQFLFQMAEKGGDDKK